MRPKNLYDRFTKLDIEPQSPKLGTLIYADGTTFDPGEGEGFYYYDGSSWIFLGGHTVNVNSQTDSYQLQLTDANDIVIITKATAVNLTVPPNSTVAFPIGTQIVVIQGGAGALTIVAGSGVTVNTPETLILEKQHAAVSLFKTATNTWYVAGYIQLA